QRLTAPVPRAPGADGAEERSLQVEGAHWRAYPPPGLEARAHGKHRHPHRGLVETGLAPHPERTQHLAMVAGVAEHRVLSEAGCLEAVEQPPQQGVDIADGSEVSRTQLPDQLL